MAEVSSLRDLEELRGYTKSNPLSVSQQEAIAVLSDRGQLPIDYKYGGDTGLAGPFIGERRPILRQEQSMIVGYNSDGSAIIETIPAQYGPSEFDSSYSPARRGLSKLNDVFFGDANEQSAALSGITEALRAVPEYLKGQYDAGMGGGTVFNPETQQIQEFDPTAVMLGGAPAGLKAVRNIPSNQVILGTMGSKTAKYTPDQRRAMDELESQGMDTENLFLHGTSDDIRQPSSWKTGYRDSGWIGEGFYGATPDGSRISDFYANTAAPRFRNEAGDYSYPNVFPYITKRGNYKQYSLMDKAGMGIVAQRNPDYSKNLTQKNIDEGFIGAEVIDGEGQIVERVNYFPDTDTRSALNYEIAFPIADPLKVELPIRTKPEALPGGGVNYQWMRNAEGGQTGGNKQSVVPFTEDLFNEVRDNGQLRSKTYEEYRRKFPDVTHISVIDMADGTRRTGTIGSLDELRPPQEHFDNGWVIETNDFDSPEALLQLQTADSDLVKAGGNRVRSALRGLDPSLPKYEIDFDFPITHESSDNNFGGEILDTLDHYGVFDGVFGLGGLKGSSLGPGGSHHTYLPRMGKVADEGSRSLDYDMSVEFINKEFWFANEREKELLYEAIAEDVDLVSLADGQDNPLSGVLGMPNDIGDASWFLQNYRGKMALDQDFDAIAMSDENGVSYLVPFGSKAKYAGKNIESYDELEALRSIYDDPSSSVSLGETPSVRAGGKRVRSALNDIGDARFDPRYDSRVGEQSRIMGSNRTVEKTGVDAPIINLEDYEGRPFILGMSDRTDAGGMLTGVENVEFNNPVPLQGGQDFMFNNQGQVWASDAGPSAALHNRAKLLKEQTGQNPLFIPYRMAPTGGDYATMTGETMFSYASANMNKTNKRKLDSAMKKIIPEWKGVDNPLSIESYRSATGDQRKLALQVLDRDFRNKGGIGIGQARLAVTDPRQVNAPDFYTMNIGEITPDKPLIKGSGHATYNVGVAGQGLGTLEDGFAAPRLVPEFLRSRGVTNPENLPATEQYTMRRNVLSGTLSEDILRSLQDLKNTQP